MPVARLMKRSEMKWSLFLLNLFCLSVCLSVCVCVCVSGEKNKTAPNLLIANKVVTLDELHVMSLCRNVVFVEMSFLSKCRFCQNVVFVEMSRWTKCNDESLDSLFSLNLAHN